MSTTQDIGFEEKQTYDAKVQDVPSDGASSIDTITALVNEGTSTYSIPFSDSYIKD